MNEENRYSEFDQIKSGSLGILKQNISEGNLRVNSKIDTPYGHLLLLSAAVVCNQLEVCRYLLSIGADPNQPDVDGYTALFWSTQSNISPMIMKLLLEMGGNQHLLNSSSATVFRRLLESFDEEKANLLFENDISLTVNHRDAEDNSTMLHQAIRNLHQNKNHLEQKPVCVRICKKLISLGIHIDALDSNGESALNIATFCLCYDIIIAILSESNAMVNNFDRYGMTPLQTLCQPAFMNDVCKDRQPFRNLRFLIEGTMSVEQSFQEIDRKAVESNTEKDLLRSVRIIVQHGGEINTRNKEDRNAFYYSCLGIRSELRRVLVELGADVNIQNDCTGGETPLIALLWLRRFTQKLVPLNDFEFLINCGCNIDAVDYRGWNVLMHSIFQRRTDVAEMLLTRGANPNFIDNNRLSAMHLACWTSNIDMIEILISKGCSTNSEDLYKATPLFYCIGPRFEEIKNILLKNEANTHHEDMFGFTCHDYLRTTQNKKEQMIFYNNYHPIDIAVHQMVNETSNGILKISEVDGWIKEEKWHPLIEEKINDFLQQPTIQSYDKEIILNNVKLLLNRIAENIKLKNPALSFTPIVSGSVSEGTKITYPDEFDFLLCLDGFENSIDISEDNCPPSFCLVTQRNQMEKLFTPYFANDGILCTNNLTKSLYSIISKMISEKFIWDGLGMYLIEGLNKNMSIGTMKVYWVGSDYKFLPVSIDLVVAISVTKWWPKAAIKDCDHIIQAARTEGCLLIVKDCQESYKQPNYLRISFSRVETKILTSCYPSYKWGYMLAKAVRDWFPPLSFNADMGFSDDSDSKRYYDPVKIKSLFSSYQLKTFLFHEINNKHSIDARPTDIARNIWKGIARECKTGKYSSFFISDYLIYEDKDLDDSFGLNGYLGQYVRKMSDMIAAVLEIIADKL